MLWLLIAACVPQTPRTHNHGSSSATPLPVQAPSVQADQTERPLPATVAPPSSSYLPPHPNAQIMSSFWECRGSRYHQGADFVISGPHYGLGEPIQALGRSLVTRIGLSLEDSELYGRPLRRGEVTIRGGRELPIGEVLPVYGQVWYFTETMGSWATGNIVELEILEGELEGFTVRYMHLGAVHPELAEGDELTAGQELGVMGGTAVLQSAPHVHVDLSRPNGSRVDPAAFLGLPVTPSQYAPPCPA